MNVQRGVEAFAPVGPVGPTYYPNFVSGGIFRPSNFNNSLAPNYNNGYDLLYNTSTTSSLPWVDPRAIEDDPEYLHSQSYGSDTDVGGLNFSEPLNAPFPSREDTPLASDATSSVADFSEPSIAEGLVSAEAVSEFIPPLLPSYLLASSIGNGVSSLFTNAMQLSSLSNYQNAITSPSLGSNYLSTLNRSIDEANISKASSLMSSFSFLGPFDAAFALGYSPSTLAPQDNGFVYGALPNSS